MREVCLSASLDQLDKRVLHEVGNGIYSYDDLARTLKVTRGTVYRRLQKLEKMGVISKKIMAIPEMGKLHLSPIIVGLNVHYDHIEKVVEILKALPNTKLLWRAYGAYEIIVVLNCETGTEGATISELKRALSECKTTSQRVSVGYKWEKIDLAPF